VPSKGKQGLEMLHAHQQQQVAQQQEQQIGVGAQATMQQEEREREQQGQEKERDKEQKQQVHELEQSQLKAQQGQKAGETGGGPGRMVGQQMVPQDEVPHSMDTEEVALEASAAGRQREGGGARAEKDGQLPAHGLEGEGRAGGFEGEEETGKGGGKEDLGGEEEGVSDTGDVQHTGHNHYLRGGPGGAGPHHESHLSEYKTVKARGRTEVMAQVTFNMSQVQSLAVTNRVTSTSLVVESFCMPCSVSWMCLSLIDH